MDSAFVNGNGCSEPRRHHGRSLDELAAVAGINRLAIWVVLISAVFARRYEGGLTAAMLEGA